MLWGGWGFLNGYCFFFFLFFIYEVCFFPQMFPALGTLLLHNSLLACCILFLCVWTGIRKLTGIFFFNYEKVGLGGRMHGMNLA